MNFDFGMQACYISQDFRMKDKTPKRSVGYMSRKKCYIIAGPNGAGKTTFANEFLPVEAECLNFVNADLIAQGLSPFRPSKVAVEAGRLKIGRRNNMKL